MTCTQPAIDRSAGSSRDLNPGKMGPAPDEGVKGHGAPKGTLLPAPSGVEASGSRRPDASASICALCGPFEARSGDKYGICPSCGLDAGEVAYRERIMRLGGAEVYRQECRRAHGLPVEEKP